MVKLATWNVNGIRAAAKKGLPDWLNQHRYDIVGFNEVRAGLDQIPKEIFLDGFYHGHFFEAQKKGYSGVGILSAERPLDVIRGIHDEEFDSEGRVITAEFKDFYVVCAYFPNSQDKGARVDFKVRFCARLHDWVMHLQKTKAVILTGDFNIAHTEIDLARPKENQETAGFLPAERAWMTEHLGAGWIDTWRQQNPDAKEKYSWWSQRMNARTRNVGWRIDYHTVHQSALNRVGKADIQMHVLGSDHCPVTLEFDGALK